MTANIVGLAAAIGAFLAAWGMAEAIRRNAVRLDLVQHPNERSSHAVPTPSGGGIGIAIAGTGAGLALLVAGSGSAFFAIALTVGALAGIIGLLDDRFELSSRVRLVVQLAMAGTLLAAAGTLPPIATPIGDLPQVALYALLMCLAVWWLNLFNFMDGIDGLAGSEAIFVLVGALALAARTGSEISGGPVMWWAIAVAAACGGFLILNWPPAKIFMGDAGSGYLAATILAVALITVASGWLEYPAWAILVASFVADTTVTLVRRIASGQRWFAAHKLHAYQKLSRRWGGHGRVTLLYLGINVIWLYPLAYLAQANLGLAWVIATIAYVPLVAFCFRAGAGRPDAVSAGQTS